MHPEAQTRRPEQNAFIFSAGPRKEGPSIRLLDHEAVRMKTADY